MYVQSGNREELSMRSFVLNNDAVGLRRIPGRQDIIGLLRGAEGAAIDPGWYAEGGRLDRLVVVLC